MNCNNLAYNNDEQSRTEKLIYEIKMLKNVNSSLHTKIIQLENNNQTLSSNLEILKEELQISKNQIEFHKKENKCIIKKYKNRIDILSKELKRNDLFSKKVMGTSKTAKENLMIQEMDCIRNVNKTLLGFIDILSQKIGFDREILGCLVEVADGVDDTILQLFVQKLQEEANFQKIDTTKIL